MPTSPLPIRVPSPRHTAAAASNARKAADLEAKARLVEHSIPTFKKREERQFYREVVQSYRAAARNTLQKNSQMIETKTSLSHAGM